MPQVVMSQLPAPPACKVTNVFIVGGSFGHAIGKHLSEEPCHPTLTEYECWHVFVSNWKNSILTFAPFDAGRRLEDYIRSDVFMYEDNEQLLRQSEHGETFYEFMVSKSH